MELQVPRCESPFLERDLARAALSCADEELVRRFARDGYVIFRPTIAGFDETADRIVTGLAADHEANGRRLQDRWRTNADVRRLATDPELARVVQLLYGREPIPFQTLNFARGSEQPTHSDLAHFGSLPPRFVAAVWVALEPIGPHNGPLHYYPGSHRQPLYAMDQLGLDGDLATRSERGERYEAFVAELVDALGLPKEVVTLAKGEALVWNGNLLHGGEPITDPASTRHTQVVHFYFAGCRNYNPATSAPSRSRYDWSRVRDIRTGKVLPAPGGTLRRATIEVTSTARRARQAFRARGRGWTN